MACYSKGNFAPEQHYIPAYSLHLPDHGDVDLNFLLWLVGCAPPGKEADSPPGQEGREEGAGGEHLELIWHKEGAEGYRRLKVVTKTLVFSAR